MRHIIYFKSIETKKKSIFGLQIERHDSNSDPVVVGKGIIHIRLHIFDTAADILIFQFSL